jgi:hypothetical protein
MKKILIILASITILSACGSPRYNSSPIECNHINTVAIVKNEKTREGFLQTIETWLKSNNYDYIVTPSNSKHDPDMLTLEYVGYWAWDLALYLKEAEISAYQNGQRVGNVNYRVPYTANPKKFGKGSERINTMMDVLFGKISN